MSVLQNIGVATRVVGGQTVTLTTTLEREDRNGQLFLRAVGAIGAEIIERKHSLGAADGVDALAGLTAAQIAAAIQPDLDTLRQQVAQILATRLGVMAAGKNLT